MLNKEDFVSNFLSEIRSETACSGGSESATFTKKFAEELFSNEVIFEDFNEIFLYGTYKNQKYRVDGFTSYTGTDSESERYLNLFITDYDMNDSQDNLISTKVKTLFDRLRLFIKLCFDGNLPSYEESLPGVELVKELYAYKRDGAIDRIHLYLLTNRPISEKFSNISIDPIDDVALIPQVWGLERLYRMISTLDKELVKIDFSSIDQRGVQCLLASSNNNTGLTSYLCALPANFLADIYGKYGSDLLEGNIRVFLSTKGGVNKKIRRTIIDEPKKFFAYNNGISTTARSADIVKGPDGLFLVSATDFQIINGGQTTASLWRARRKDVKDLKDIFVQMKLTVINEEQVGSANYDEVLRNISISSNSQNKVNNADFFSTHQFHKTMEQISRRLWAPAVNGAQNETHWYYERVRGQYAQDKPEGKKDLNNFLKLNPKSQLILKTDLAKLYNMWKGIPNQVCKGAQTNFTLFANEISKEWDKDPNSYNEKFFKKFVCIFIIYKFIEKSGVITKLKAPTINYTVSLLSYLLQEQYPDQTLNFDVIWKLQAVPATLQPLLLDLAKHTSNIINSDEVSVQNISSWHKNESCWKKLKSIEYILPNIIENNLISIKEDKKDMREAKKEQKHINKTLDAIYIAQNPGIIKKVRDFIFENDVNVSLSERELLETICNSVNPSKFFNIKTLDIIQKIIVKCKEEGFK